MVPDYAPYWREILVTSMYSRANSHFSREKYKRAFATDEWFDKNAEKTLEAWKTGGKEAAFDCLENAMKEFEDSL